MVTKIGLVLERAANGPDKQVCEHLITMISPGVQIESVTLTNKNILINKCGETAETLLDVGCELVIIVWDLIPPWKRGGKSCLREDRERILVALRQTFGNDQYRTTSPPIYLVCIYRELEAWLLAYGRAISTVLSKPNNRMRVGDTKNPERIAEPKTQFINLFCNYSASLD